jgi:hypothetical protein
MRPDVKPKVEAKETKEQKCEIRPDVKQKSPILTHMPAPSKRGPM